MADAMHDDIDQVAPGYSRAMTAMVGAFEVVDLGSSLRGTEQNLD